MERKFEWRSSNGQDYLYAQGQSRHDLGYAIGQGLHRQISAARTLYQAALSRNLENSARELLAQAIAGYQSAIPPQDMEEIMGMRTVSVIKSLCPAPVMTPRSVLVRRALRRERSIDSLRAMTDEQGRSPFSYNLIVSDASTVSAAQAIPSEQRICQVKRTLVQSNQFDNEPVICRKKIQDGLGTTVLFFTRESFGRGNPADQPAGQLPF